MVVWLKPCKSRSPLSALSKTPSESSGGVFLYPGSRRAIRGAGFVGGPGVAASALVTAERFTRNPIRELGWVLLCAFCLQRAAARTTTGWHSQIILFRIPDNF